MRNPDVDELSAFDSLYAEAEAIAEEMEISAEFPRANAVRTRRRRRQNDYEGQDEPIVEPREKFEIEFYTYVLESRHCNQCHRRTF